MANNTSDMTFHLCDFFNLSHMVLLGTLEYFKEAQVEGYTQNNVYVYFEAIKQALFDSHKGWLCNNIQEILFKISTKSYKMKRQNTSINAS